MNREKYLKEITKLLAVLKAEIELSNSNNLTDVNIHSENFYRDFLNTLYGYNLENTNFSQQNFPSVDLVDESKKIAIQVTATSSVGKTQKTVDTFIKKNLHKKCDRLIILNITEPPPIKESRVNSDSAIHNWFIIGGRNGTETVKCRRDYWPVTAGGSVACRGA